MVLVVALRYGRFVSAVVDSPDREVFLLKVLGTALLVGALFSFAPLIIADLQRTNRVLLEETIEQLRLVRFGPPRIPPVHDDEGR